MGWEGRRIAISCKDIVEERDTVCMLAVGEAKEIKEALKLENSQLA